MRVDPISQEKSEITVTAISTPRQGLSLQAEEQNRVHRKVNPLLGPGPGGVGNVWFSEPHYLIGKGRPLSRPLSRLPIDVSLYPSSRSRNCRIIGVSNYRSLEQIEKLSQYRCIELSIPRADRETVAISESRALWRDCKSHQAPTSKRRGLGGYADAKR